MLGFDIGSVVEARWHTDGAVLGEVAVEAGFLLVQAKHRADHPAAGILGRDLGYDRRRGARSACGGLVLIRQRDPVDLADEADAFTDTADLDGGDSNRAHARLGEHAAEPFGRYVCDACGDLLVHRGSIGLCGRSCSVEVRLAR